MIKGLLASCVVAVAAATASAGNINIVLSSATPEPYLPNVNITVCVGFNALDPADTGTDPDPDNPLDQTLLFDVIGVQFDWEGSGLLPIANPGVPSVGTCSSATSPTPGGAVFTAGTATVWANPTVGPDHLTLFHLTPGTLGTVFRAVLRPTMAGTFMFSAVGPTNPDPDHGASIIALDGSTWENGNPNTHGAITGTPLTLNVVPEPTSIGLLAIGALAFVRRRVA